MGKVIFSNGVLQNLEDLAFILFYKDYFSFQINAFLYTDSIIDFVEKSIHTFPPKKTPKHLSHLGLYYIFFQSNAQNTWFVFFEQHKSNYLVTGILNNHCSEAQFI